MNFIKKIVDNKMNNALHLQFQKFSKGEFRNRAIIEAKNSNGKYTIKTSAEFVNEIVETAAKKLGDEKTGVKGAIVSTSDLTEELDFKEKKQFQGVKRYMIDAEMSGTEIISLLDRFPKTFFALSFKINNGETEIKTKPKAPTTGKPGKNQDAPKADFCILKTTDRVWGQSFVFENPNFKSAQINHTFFIEEIVIPEELKKSQDFAKIREESKRKGKLLRKAIIDGQETTKEFEFEI